MFTELFNYSHEPPKLVGTIRIVDGKLQLTGNVDREHLEEEYAFFKTKVKGDDAAFLKDRLSFVFERNTYLGPVFHPEG